MANAGRWCSAVRDAKGVRDLALLLTRPGHAVAALDLVAPGTPVAADLGEVFDDTARSAYKARLVTLEGELDGADAAGDAARSERLQAEREALLAPLAGAYGLGGRPRRTGGSLSGRARPSPRGSRDAVRRIGAAHPELGRHLARPDSVIATEVFTDRAALDRQEAQPEVAKVMDVLPHALAAPPEATIYHVSSAEEYA